VTPAAESPAYVEVVLPKGKQAEMQESAAGSEEMVELETEAGSDESSYTESNESEDDSHSPEAENSSKDININEIKEVMNIESHR